jgi:hypothetical protein
MSTIQTETWIITLPDDWEEEEPCDGQLYFESEDGTKGLYIATWNLGGDEPYTPEQAATDFRTTELNCLHSMDGYSWEILEDNLHNHAKGTDISIDSLDAAKNYRIFIKILSRPPIVVCAAFHDYLCENIFESKKALNPFIESLKICSESAV